MRIFHNQTEITKQTERPTADVYALTYTAGDFIYIASDFPFNHLFFTFGTTKNTNPATMKVEYYSNAWNEVVELRDETEAFSREGYIEFVPDKNSTWACMDTSSGIITKVVYQKYWMRISFNASLTAADLSFVGNKFSDDTDLFVEFPIFDNADYMTAFKAGKTSWQDQHIKAGELIIDDLIKKKIILGKEQILDRKRFTGASVCKVAEMIFNAFGNDYSEQRKEARNEYLKRLDLNQYSVDTNNDGKLDKSEVVSTQGWLSR